MNSEKIPFDRARAALREGNPYPMLSDKIEWPSDVSKSSWCKKAAVMLETLDSIRSRAVSVKVANEVKQIFVSDSDTRNVGLAKKFLTELLAACSAVTDEDYAKFLSGLIPSKDIPEAVARSRQYLDHVAAHIKTLVEGLPRD